MNHAVFWVTPNERWSSHELIPFLEFRSIHTAGSHFSNGIGESSKIVPVFRENVGRECPV